MGSRGGELQIWRGYVQVRQAARARTEQKQVWCGRKDGRCGLVAREGTLLLHACWSKMYLLRYTLSRFAARNDEGALAPGSVAAVLSGHPTPGPLCAQLGNGSRSAATIAKMRVAVR